MRRADKGNQTESLAQCYLWSLVHWGRECHGCGLALQMAGGDKVMHGKELAAIPQSVYLQLSYTRWRQRLAQTQLLRCTAFYAQLNAFVRRSFFVSTSRKSSPHATKARVFDATTSIPKTCDGAIVRPAGKLLLHCLRQHRSFHIRILRFLLRELAIKIRSV